MIEELKASVSATTPESDGSPQIYEMVLEKLVDKFTNEPSAPKPSPAAPPLPKPAPQAELSDFANTDAKKRPKLGMERPFRAQDLLTIDLRPNALR